MPVGCVGATDVRHVAIMHYWALNEGLPVPAAKILETPFYAPVLRFRTINVAGSSTCSNPARTITAGNFPPVMAHKSQTVSNESQTQTRIQPQQDAIEDIGVHTCSNPSWSLFLPPAKSAVAVPKRRFANGSTAAASDS